MPAGDEADAFIVPARQRRRRRQGSACSSSRAAPAASRSRGYRARRTARRAAELSCKAATGSRSSPPDGLAALEHAVDIGIAALCAEAVGVMDKLVALTVEYMNTRKQFGVTIATFQALRHRMADVKMQLELARSMSYLRDAKLGEPADAAAPRAVAGQGAARRVDALRRPAVQSSCTAASA